MRVPFPSPTDCAHRLQRGFSLVEAVLAIGTAATVVVVLIGLIPSSLDQMSEAARTTAEARIVQAVVANYQMRPWQDILTQQQSGIEEDTFFDSQGAPVEEHSPDRYFTARVSVHDAPMLPGTYAVNDRLRQVLVRLTDRPDIEAAFRDPKLHHPHPVVIAQTDKMP